MANMASSLIEHKRISTTVAKAKALRGFVEPLITKAKDDTTHSRRMAFRKLANKEAVSELFREVGPKVGDRPGGYTRIIKTGFRQGDSAEMCIIELVDFNELYSTEKKEATKKTRRSRRGGGSAKPQAEAAPVAEEVVEEAVEAVEETTEATAEAVEETAEVVEETAEVAEAPAETTEEVVEEAAEVVEEVEAATEATEESSGEAADEASTEEDSTEEENKEGSKE